MSEDQTAWQRGLAAGQSRSTNHGISCCAVIMIIVIAVIINVNDGDCGEVRLWLEVMLWAYVG